MVFRKIDWCFYPALVLSGFTLVAFLILMSAPVSAENTMVDNVSITIPESCTLSTTYGSDKTYAITMQGGQYKNDIGDTTIVAFCNTQDSFGIYAIGFSNNTYGNTEMISAEGNNNIVTGTATSGDTSNWAMKLAAISAGDTNNGTTLYTPTIENGYNNFSVIPSSYVKVASVDSTVGYANQASINATYAVYIALSQAAGSYTGKVKYTVVHPSSEAPLQSYAATPQCISYWPNAAGVVDSMGDQCGFSNNATVSSLWASNFRRQGYGFVGWSDKFDWVLNENDANGNGTGANAGYHIYGPNATITAPRDMAEKGLSLYAVWAKSSGTLQNWNGCNILPTGKVTALTDQRDNNTYAVAKLADGNCWMIENLRLDNTNSDNTTGALAQDYGTSTTYGNFSGLAEPETSGFSSTYSANSLYSNDGSNNTINIGRSYSPSYRIPRFNNQNTASSATNMTNTSGDAYSYGNWYNWSAAIADTTYYNSGNHNTTSICPKGWHIPTGNTGGEFSVLDTAMGGDGSTQNTAEASRRWRRFPNNFVYSGYFSGNSTSNRGGLGQYWSSSVYSSDSSYYLRFGSSNVYPGTSYYDKYFGFSARCVLGS